MKAISLFSGAGGLDLGFNAAGFSTVLACEMNKDACATYRRNISDAIFEGDIRDLIPSLQKHSAQVVYGGPPCQGLSVAGKMNPDDPRSTLIDSFFDVVDKITPDAFVMENVDALLVMGKWAGRLDAVKERAAELGYGIHCMVLNSADFGAPQARKRFFAFGIRGFCDADVFDATAELTARTSASPTPALSVFKRLGPQGTERNPATSKAVITFSKNPVMRRTAYAGMLFNGAGRPIDPSRPAPTITASAGGNKTHIVDEAQVFENERAFSETYHLHLREGGNPGALRLPTSLRRLTVKESQAFQTFPDDFIFDGPISSQYRQIGNAVPAMLAAAVAKTLMKILTKRANGAEPRSVPGMNMAA